MGGLSSQRREDIGSTRNLSLHLDNNCIARNCLKELFWNSVETEDLQLPVDSLAGKLWLISIISGCPSSSPMAESHAHSPGAPCWSQSKQWGPCPSIRLLCSGCWFWLLRCRHRGWPPSSQSPLAEVVLVALNGATHVSRHPPPPTTYCSGGSQTLKDQDIQKQLSMQGYLKSHHVWRGKNGGQRRCERPLGFCLRLVSSRHTTTNSRHKEMGGMWFPEVEQYDSIFMTSSLQQQNHKAFKEVCKYDPLQGTK